MALARPLPHDQTSTKQFSTDKQPLLDTPEMERHPQLPPPSRGLNWKLASKLGLSLILAVFYVGFCFIVQYRNVPIGGSGVLGLPFFHFSTESGITTVAILIVYVVLWPVKGVLDEIRSEEFFRLLRTHPNGVPLDRVNAVSAPTNGAFDIFLATIHRHCSPLLTYTLAIALVITATSSLAPAALNTQSILIDVDDPDFQIGAIANQPTVHSKYGQQKTKLDWGRVLPCEASAFKTKYILWCRNLISTINDRIDVGDTLRLYSEAAAMSWVENSLNLTNTYYTATVATSEDDPSGYIVPFPPGYHTTMQAYWTTDIIVLNPSCSWKTPEMTGVVDVGKPGQDQLWPIPLVSETNTLIELNSDAFASGSRPIAKASVFYPYNSVNSDSESFDGSVVFVISQLPGSSTNSSWNITDLSALPTLQFSNGNILAFLQCFPHASIQTRQVRTTGNGILTLGRTQQQRQENLNIDLVNTYLWEVMSYFPTSSGPPVDNYGAAAMMAKLMFGDNLTPFPGPSDPGTPPAPLANITAMYKLAIQSAMKTLVSGTLGTANVSGGLGVEQLAFSSSLGHVITSAILFAILMIALVAAQYRKGRDAFTLTHVAAALEGSDVPKECMQMRQLFGRADAIMVRLVLDDNKEGERIVLITSETDESVST